MSVLETTILLGQSNDFLSPKIKPETPSKKNEFGNKINFLLCEACFWCASQSNNCNTNNIITECPSCKSNQIESMPISQGEIYTFSHNRIRGITLKFSNHRDVLK